MSEAHLGRLYLNASADVLLYMQLIDELIMALFLPSFLINQPVFQSFSMTSQPCYRPFEFARNTTGNGPSTVKFARANPQQSNAKY